MEKIAITPRGRKMLEDKIEAQKQIIDAIRKEKEIAYECSGDGWHDNPGFNNLMAEEQRAIKALVELQKKLAGAIVIENGAGPSDRVKIGAVVKIGMNNMDDGSQKEMTIEIAGSGESDVKNNLIAYDTPIGKAVINLRKDEEAVVKLPVGRVKLKILNIS